MFRFCHTDTHTHTYTHTRARIECIIFSLRVAIDIRATMSLFSLWYTVQYMFPSKFENMQQQRQQQQQPLPIYFEVEFDLNDNFFQLYFAWEKKTLCALVRAFVLTFHRFMHVRSSCNIVISHRLHWIHHFRLINNNRWSSNLFWHSTFFLLLWCYFVVVTFVDIVVVAFAAMLLLLVLFLLSLLLLLALWFIWEITEYTFEIIWKLVSHTK